MHGGSRTIIRHLTLGGLSSVYLAQLDGGKQSYIALEQFRGKATTQSDIYAFGGTLYYLLTGSDPEALTQSEPDKIKENITTGLAQLLTSCPP
jgi:serine/threonine protein kinase